MESPTANPNTAEPNYPKGPNDEPNHPNDEAETDPDISNERQASSVKRVNRISLEQVSNGTKLKETNKLNQALLLPTIMNLNPSVYNKVEDFHTFVEVEEIDCIFLSESWERPDQPLEEIIILPDHTVVSNPHQRGGIGGRPAIIINHKKYNIRNITQSLIQIPWGTEAVWAIITPKSINKDTTIQSIALCSFYSRPNSRLKTQLLDHINQAFHIISTKCKRGFLAADSNDLKFDNILNLSPQMRQMAKGITRLNPPRMLDPIFTTLHPYYQEPKIFPPLDPDPDSN